MPLKIFFFFKFHNGHSTFGVPPLPGARLFIVDGLINSVGNLLTVRFLRYTFAENIATFPEKRDNRKYYGTAMTINQNLHLRHTESDANKMRNIYGAV